MLNLTIETLQPAAPIRAYAAPRLMVYGGIVELTAGGSHKQAPEGTNQGEGSVNGCKNPINMADKSRNRC